MYEIEWNSCAVIPNDGMKDRYKVKSVGHALDIIDVLTQINSEGMSTTQIAKEINLSKSATFSILQTLLQRRYIADTGNGITREYHLGMALAVLGDQAISQTPLSELAMPELRMLTKVTTLTSRIGILTDCFVQAIARVQGPGTLRLSSVLGLQEPVHTTSIGKAILSNLSAETVKSIISKSGLIQRTPKSIKNITELTVDLRKSLERGYSIEDEEDTLGVLSIGANIWAHTGECAAAVCVTGLKLDIQASQIEEIGKSVKQYADKISQGLGGGQYTRPKF